MATQSVRIPIELELKNVQSAINSLKNALEGVSKESGFYKTISKELEQVEKKYKELSAVASRPFNSVSSITSFENQFLKLGDRITSIGKSFEDLKFKDLDLKGIPNAEEQFNKLNQQVKEAQKALDSINTDQMKAALGNPLNSLTVALEEIKKISGKDNLVDGENFERTFSKINQEAQNTTLELEKANKALTDFKTKLQGNEEQLNLFKEVEKQVQGVTSKADLLGKIGGIASSVNMTPEDLLDRLGLNKPNMYTGAAEEIQKRLNDAISRSKTKLTNAIVKDKQQENNYQAQIAELNKYLAALQQAQAEMDKLQNSSATQGQMDAARQKLENASAAFDNFIKNCLKSSPAINQAGDAIDAIGNSANSVSPKFNAARNEIQRLTDASRNLDNLKSRLAYFFSFYKIMGTVRKVVREATTTIKELDSVMTQISVVTKMTQKDLWDQIDAYSAIANEYAVSIKGTYEVSQLYYQQGLQTAEVMDLTVETLKMAKIANLKYATATDYMTVAIRGFKMEMSDAQRVTDVYSALAAGTASDTKELAVAMSKTASSAEAVGSSFESTSAMIATMVSITREAPENIGSALKSIISRYGEMTTNPLKLVDEEGEEMSLNKVDKALQSVGISLQDANGQFRDFDDVILELAQSWNTIDTNTQRYIATVMAGNRQQSRFLALVGNYDEYSRALELANNSEDASAQQVLKTMDSIESKLTNIKTAWQQFYTSLGLEDLFKNTLDIITQIINNINKMSKAEAIITIFNIFNALKGLVMGIFAGISAEFSKIKNMGNEALSEFKRQQEVKIDTAQPKQELERLNKILLEIFKQKLNLDVSEAKAKLEALGFKTKELVQRGTNIGTNLTTNAPMYASMAQQAQGLNTGVFSAAQLNQLLGLSSHRNAKKLTDEFNRVFGKDAPMAVDSFKNYLTDFIKNSNLPGFSSNTLDSQAALKGFIAHLERAGSAAEKKFAKELERELNEKRKSGQIITRQDKSISQQFLEHSAGLRVAASTLQTAGALLTTAALTMKDSSEKNKEWSKIAAGGGTFISGIGSAISGALMGAPAGPLGMIVGAISAGLPSFISGITQMLDGLKMTTEERIGLLNEELKEAEKKETVEKGEALNLENSIREFEKLEKAQFDSAEAAEVFRNHMNSMGEQYPQLIESMDASGNAIIDTVAAEQMLAEARYEAAKAALETAEVEYNLKEQEAKRVQEAQEIVQQDILVSDFDYDSFLENGDDFRDLFSLELNKRQIEVLSAVNENAVENKTGTRKLKVFGSSVGSKDYTYQVFSKEGRLIIGDIYQAIQDGTYALLTDAEKAVAEEFGIVSSTAAGVNNFNLENITLEGLAEDSLARITAWNRIQEISEKLEITDPQKYFNISDEMRPEEIFEAIQTVLEFVNGKIKSTGDSLIDSANLFEISEFDTDLTELSVLDASKREFIKNYGPMLSRLGLEMVKDSLNTDNVTAKKNENEEEYLDAHKAALEIIENSLLTASKSSMEQVVDLFNNFDKIKSSADIESALQEVGLYSTELFNAFNSVYKDYTSSARERIEGAADRYSIDREKLGIKTLFDGKGNIELSTQYTDKVIDSMNLVDDYAEEGLRTKSNILNNAIVKLYSSIAELDTDLQNSLFSITSEVDWASATSLKTAIDAINSFIEQDPNSTDELQDTLNALQYALDNLPINILTEIQGYTDLIRSSIEKTKENVAGMTDGLETSDALSKTDQLTSVEGFEDLNFNDLFIFDEKLGKYVYSLKGFEATIAKQEQELAERQATVENAIAELEEINLVGLVKTSPTGQKISNQTIAKVFSFEYLDWEEKVDRILNLDHLDDGARAAVVDAMKGFDPEGNISLEEYLTNYVTSIEDEYERATIEAALLREERIHALKNSLNFNSLGAGSASEGQKNTLAQLLKKTNDFVFEATAETLADTIIGGGEAGLAALNSLGDSISYDDKVAYLEGSTESYTSVINKVLEEPGTVLTEAEAELLRKIDSDLVDEKNGFLIAQKVENLGTLINDILENTALTLAQQNELIAQAYEIDFSRKNPAAEFGSKSSLSYSDLSKLATIQGQSIQEAILNSVSNGLKQNAFTGEFEVVDFNAYWQAIGGSISNATTEYLDAYSDWVDEQISKNNNFSENVSQSLGDLQDAKVGDQINIVYFTAALEEAGLVAETFLQNYGIAVEDGIATLGENTNIYGLMQEITKLESSGAIELSDSLGELKDSIQDIFKSWTTALSAGLTGELSNTEVETLKQQFNFLSEADFSETKNGLKMSKEAAYELYRSLVGINSIQAELAFDALVENAVEADESLNNVYKVIQKIDDINEQIAKTEPGSERRKTLETELQITEQIKDNLIAAGDAFNFMDQDLPTGMTNPLSAWEGMGDAFKVLDGEDFAAGYMDFTDLYNMINQMKAAGVTLQTEAGAFELNSENAAAMIEAAAGALTNVDGETFVDLSKLGTQFKFGTEGMKEGLTDGIHTLAQNQIDMLDAEIALLETVVKTQEAFESISGDDNKIDLGEFNPFRDEDGNLYWSTQQETLLNNLNTYTGGFIQLSEGVLNLNDLITDPNIWQSLKEEDKQKVLDYFNLIQDLTSEIDWSLSPTENFEAFKTLATQLQESDLDIDWNSLIDSWTSGLDETSAEEIKRKIIQHLGGTVSEEGTITIPYTYGNAAFQMSQTSGGEIEYISPDGTGKGPTPEDALMNEFAQKVVSGESNGMTYEEYKIFMGYVTPQVEINSEALAGLDGEIRNKIAEVVNGDGKVTEDTVDALVSLGFEVQVGDELSSDQIAALRSALNIEDKIINLTVNATNVDTEIYNLLNGTTADIPTTITLTVENGENVQTTLSTIKDTLIELESRGYNIELAYNITTTSDNEGTYDVTLNDQGTVETLTNLAQALTNLNIQASALKDSANAITSTGSDNVKALKEQMDVLPDKSTEVGNTAAAIDTLHDKSRPVSNTATAIDSLKSKSITASITVKVTAPNPTPGSRLSSVVGLTSRAKGNIALAKGTGKAAAKGKTLMGELGPELVVSNGHYYVVGQNGAEFVDLADDAIVFNHLQTKKLLGSGGMVGTGEPVTNERNAVAFASGNVSGPAMASASDALAELKQIRAMWEALLNSSASDLGKKAGSGGGGGGGGGGGSTEDVKAVTGELERWYNLLRQIDSLEQHITLEQAKRANLMNGYKYVDSLEAELDMLKEQQQAYKKLAELQKDYYDRRREDLLSTDYSKIFTYTEHGLMQYVDGENRGLDILAKLNERDATGKLINNAVNAKAQLKYLKNVGFDTSILKYNDDGTKAENEEQMMENFWANVDGWMEELDGLYDSYHEATTNFEESTEKINEILQEYIDNQLAVEEKLMQAIQDREQAEIDRIQDEKDALEEAAQSYIDGLNEALSKERDMYQKNETDAETAKLQRQLAILQRSGGSTSEIKSLQDQIDSRLQDAYFQEQQNQIDAIQEASDNQIEKLQIQIDLMTETLEYQKENGLLWQEVYEMMNNWTPEQLLQFVEQYTKSYKEDSALENEEKSKETLKEDEIWVANRTNKEREQAWNDYYNSANYDKELKEANKDKAFSAYQTAYESGGKEAAETAANKVFENAKNSNIQQEDSASKTEEEKKEPAKTEPPISITGKLKGGNVHMRAKADANSKVIKKIPKGTTVTLTGMSKKKNDGYYWFKASAAGKSGYMAYTSRWGDFSGNVNELPKFEKGGLVDFTGPAWVDGTKTKPEAFLSADDTAMLKSRIFSNSDGSLKALVAALEAITDNTSKYSAQTNTESIVIQNAQVNIQPGTISNDYDARRAGEMALEEMVKIARKTTNRVVSR